MPARAGFARFLAFAVVGTGGFVVDAGVLQLLISYARLGPYAARAGSFLAAVTFTWAANRAYTFRDAEHAGPAGAQWARYLLVNAVGGAVNLGVYGLLVACVAAFAAAPVLAVAAGSLAGLAFNFTLSRALVFRAAGAATRTT